MPFIDEHEVARVRSLTVGKLIWNNYDLRERLGFSTEQLGRRMEEIAAEHRWMKLRDDAGTVRAIGLPKSHPDRKERSARESREQMFARLLLL